MGNLFESTTKFSTADFHRIIWNTIMKVNYDRHDLAKVQVYPRSTNAVNKQWGT